ncbi:MAG: tRNA uracil 4-sulfurtransferase ThiI [Eubacteriales bacterium]|nr:tRNA uracil 4-sulfurtransferase ThiI [Eubacteriales bacterium]
MYSKKFLIKYAEIGIKGKNRYRFEDALCHQIKRKLKTLFGEFKVYKEQERIYVEVIDKNNDSYNEFSYNEIISSLKEVFGISSISPIYQFEKTNSIYDLASNILNYIENTFDEKNFTFKVHTKRLDKYYPLTSNEINCELGGVILDNYPNTKVDVHTPMVFFYVEIRNKINIYSENIKGLGGMPLGTNGKAMLLLSGGIDSPLAGYMIAKRGVKIDAIYFDAPPYTSDRAKQKVIDLAIILSKYTGAIPLNIINFTQIQLAIYDKCPHDELTIIMRRFMMKIAQKIAIENECLGLITGESIGQVASQTMHSLMATNEVCTIPVYRPLIGFDKQEIIEKAISIGTYETSIQPFEDCCTIFVAKHPVTKPSTKIIKRSEEMLNELNIDEMIQKAIDEKQVIWCK